ncbi:MAG TPA: hypothetical protein EYP39_09190 [Ghiorsea sp.]|nr:hypothetical protein [Ghiorsea sp.]
MAKDNYSAGNSKQWGVTKHRGARTTSLARGSEVHSTNRERELHWEFDFDDLPRFHSHAFTANMWIPDGAIVKDITFEVTEKFVGDKDAQLQIGLMDSNGDILSYDYFGIVDKVAGKEAGWQWFNNTAAPVSAGAQPMCDGQNYSLLHICAVSPDGTPCTDLFTCGEARLTITMKTPFYAYHYDGKGVNAQVDCFSLIPNKTQNCEPCEGEKCYNPCIGAKYKEVEALPELCVTLPLDKQEVPCPCPEKSEMDCVETECPECPDAVDVEDCNG